jgi:hypothetical protein
VRLWWDAHRETFITHRDRCCDVHSFERAISVERAALLVLDAKSKRVNDHIVHVSIEP